MSIKKPINDDDSQESDHSSSIEEDESSNEQNESIFMNNGAIQNFIPGFINPICNFLQFQAIPNYYVPYFYTFASNNSYFQPTIYNPYSNLQIPYYYNPYLQYLPPYSQPILNNPMIYLNSPYYFPNINTGYMIQPQQIPNLILTKSTSRKYHKKSQQKKKTKKSKSILKSPKDKITTSNAATSSNSIIKQETPIENKIEQKTPIENKIKQETPIENKIKPYCTFAATGKIYIQQAWYECETCKREGKFGFNEGICEVCARTCHQGHDVHLKEMSDSFYCGCPLKCNCQSNPRNPDLTCTKKSTVGTRISQPMYFCKTCSKHLFYDYICQNCAVREHHGHNLIYKGIIHNEICHNDDLYSQNKFGKPSESGDFSDAGIKKPNFFTDIKTPFDSTDVKNPFHFSFEKPSESEGFQSSDNFSMFDFKFPPLSIAVNPWSGK